MVEELAEIQRLARWMIETGRARPYDKSAHAKAVDGVFEKLKSLALSGDVV